MDLGEGGVTKRKSGGAAWGRSTGDCERGQLREAGEAFLEEEALSQMR